MSPAHWGLSGQQDLPSPQRWPSTGCCREPEGSSRTPLLKADRGAAAAAAAAEAAAASAPAPASAPGHYEQHLADEAEQAQHSPLPSNNLGRLMMIAMAGQQCRPACSICTSWQTHAAACLIDHGSGVSPVLNCHACYSVWQSAHGTLLQPLFCSRQALVHVKATHAS